jgi:hypothetical protein
MSFLLPGTSVIRKILERERENYFYYFLISFESFGAIHLEGMVQTRRGNFR